MFDVTTIYFVSAAVLGLVAVLFGVTAIRLPASCRRYGLVTVVAAGAMALSYLGMAGEFLVVETTGGNQSAARFLGYTFSWGGICYLIGTVSGVGRTRTVLLFGALSLSLWGTLASWILEGALELAATVVILGGLTLVTYFLLGPFDRAAETVSPDRTLLYGKLKHLLLLGWVVLVVLGAVSEQNLALVDTFVGQLVATYVDVVLFVGFGGFVLNNVGALEDVSDDAAPISTATPDLDTA